MLSYICLIRILPRSLSSIPIFGLWFGAIFTVKCVKTGVSSIKVLCELNYNALNEMLLMLVCLILHVYPLVNRCFLGKYFNFSSTIT